MICEYTSPWDKGETAEGIVKDSILPVLSPPTDSPASASSYQDYRIFYTSFDDESSVIHMCTKNYKVQYSLLFQEQVHALWEESGGGARFQSTLKDQVEEFTLR